VLIRNELHKNICECSGKVIKWYTEKLGKQGFPIYSSYDIRDSGFKVTNVDANIYPAGFNNICPVDQEVIPELFTKYLNKKYGQNINKILLVTEEHTNNAYYWENVRSIKTHLEEAGKKILVSFPRRLDHNLNIQSATGYAFDINSGYPDSPAVKEFSPDLIISNNDFSDAHAEWAKDFKIPINPARELGWYQRKKSRYFHHYNQLIEEFSHVIGSDPFFLNVKTEIFENFDLSSEESKKELADRVDKMIAELKVEYKKRKIESEPFVFVKNNSGTYGLAVIRVGSGKEILEWNNKSRKKMKAAKGGRDVEEVIIQEGVPSRVQSDGATAEPVIYMVGCELAGGFLRTHQEKDSTESLNSPGAVYKKLCVSDLNVSLEGSPLENVYGWSARIGLLAIAYEGLEMGVKA
jgi:glutamate--cysteine ligase